MTSKFHIGMKVTIDGGGDDTWYVTGINPKVDYGQEGYCTVVGFICLLSLQGHPRITRDIDQKHVRLHPGNYT